MRKMINGKEVLVDYGGRTAPSVPEGKIAVLVDDEWVLRNAKGFEQREMEEITLEDVATMVGQLITLYPTRFTRVTDDQIATTSLAWYDKVKGMDRELISRAFGVCTSEMSMPPTIADVLKKTKELRFGKGR